MSKIKITLYFLLLTFSFSKAQNLEGVSGLFFIPTANMFSDRTLTVGTNFIHRSKISFGGYKEDAISPYFTLTFLPFTEFNVRVTRLLNSKSSTQGIGDRTMSVRFRFMEESNYFPSILVGFHDLAAVYGGSGAVHNNALYVVISKNITMNNWLRNIGLHIGYGTDKVKARTHQFVGLFGGLSFNFYNFLELMTEYDGKYSNGGVRIKLFDHFNLLAGFLRYKHFSGGAAFSWVL